jgi:hypothetical protein
VRARQVLRKKSANPFRTQLCSGLKRNDSASVGLLLWFAGLWLFGNPSRWIARGKGLFRRFLHGVGQRGRWLRRTGVRRGRGSLWLWLGHKTGPCYPVHAPGNIQQNAEAPPSAPKSIGIDPARLVARSRHNTERRLREWLQEFTAPFGGAAGGESGTQMGASAGSAAADLPFPTASSMAANSSAERMGLGR